MANRKISDLTALTAPATGDLLPIVDISEAAAADKNKKITYGELLASAPAGSAAAPSFSFDSDPDSGLYSAGANQVAISTNGTGKLYINSNGDINIGHSSSSYSSAGRGLIAVNGSSSSIVDLQTGTTSRFRMFCDGTDVELVNTEATGVIKFGTNNAERMRLTSAGLLGLGTSSPSQKLQIATGNVQIDSNYGFIWDNSTTGIYGNSSPSVLQFYTGNAERARIDSSGRLLVGTSSNSGGALFQVNGDRVRIATAKTPASASDTGVAGEICWDANYVYVCTATNTWKRTAISTW